MGAPKQKWTSEEESALKSGVIKHGVGKWRTILKDPEYSSILFLRSNVDLKDKWRNMSVTANGWGSREKARTPLRRTHHHHHPHSHHVSQSDDEEDMSDTSEEVESDDDDDNDNDNEIVAADVKPLAVSSGILHIAPPPPPRQQSLSRLETLIMEAITSLKEPSGSNKTSIAVYIEDQYNTPPNFKRILSAKVKGLASNGRLIKVNRKYRIAPSSSSISGVRRSSPAPAVVIAPPLPPPPPLSLPAPPAVATVAATAAATIRIEKEDMRNLMKSQIDAELAKMRSMSVQEAGAAAARAVAEAEAAMAEAEEAAREAEAAEADADAAQAFAEAAMTTLRSRYSNNLMVRG